MANHNNGMLKMCGLTRSNPQYKLNQKKISYDSYNSPPYRLIDPCIRTGVKNTKPPSSSFFPLHNIKAKGTIRVRFSTGSPLFLARAQQGGGAGGIQVIPSTDIKQLRCLS